MSSDSVFASVINSFSFTFLTIRFIVCDVSQIRVRYLSSPDGLQVQVAFEKSIELMQRLVLMKLVMASLNSWL